MRIPLMLFSIESAARIGNRLQGLGKYVVALHPGIKYDLRALGLSIEPQAFGAAAFLSALVWGALFGFLGYGLLYLREFDGPLAAYGVLVGLAFFLLALTLHIFYPGILAKNIASSVDRDLVFALQDLMIQVSSGISLYDAMTNIAHSNYGYVSNEFEITVKRISSGMSESDALEEMVFRTQSDAFRKLLWQLITTLQSGASIKPALASVIETLLNEQHRAIRNYAASLNFLILLYMLFAVVAPSIGITLLTILAGFSGIGVTESTLLMLVGAAFVGQAMLIGFMKRSRPRVYV
ncbi:MAG: type II secretion system F family protein [Candidatus Burarchaeum sp.]|nr:type II secretion system F family protein [Candidatus Burarchaeum sp.]MDO8339211.1 type II secretion system F family protein [Candidatus Burarchaeum sp.]